MRLASKTTHVNNIPLSELAITAAQVGGILKRKMETGGLKTVFALESDCPGLDPDSSPY